MINRLPSLPEDAPERQALTAQWSEARRLREEVVELELEKSTREAELERFQTTYLNRLGDLYLRLDLLEAEWLGLCARREPLAADRAERARDARARAEHTADDVAAAREKPERPPFRPTAELKANYRQAARSMHPDLASDDEETRVRHDFMVRLNGAYARGDEERIHQLVVEWEAKLLPADDEDEVGRALVRAIRVVATLGQTIQRLREEIDQLAQSELAQLHTRVESARARGEHPLAELQAELQSRIDVIQAQLRTPPGGRSPGSND